ncbi:uncharacterized protein TNIN_197431 [Trichonephila inaurata madagascariensis]|uniref:Uncharacterized protein n=1 Tax=Trichonephila inaurata madagascariensis TaxID=2747483 RepID=A0A8X7CND8_9ARAC|nr:uncharacterized protein TNIN_197431 [Trichonephila inaurata madagascariensis]
MSCSLLLLIFGVSVIYVETVVFGFTSEEKELELKNIKKICGFRKCSEDQCCVGNFVIGYCLNSPAEGEPCANRTSKKEEYFCGRCGDSMACVDEFCMKKGNDTQNLRFSSIDIL